MFVSSRSFIQVVFLLFIFLLPIHAQEKSPADSATTFGTLQQSPADRPLPGIPRNSWGIDLLVSTNGFGLGSFYRHEYSEELSGFVDFSISEAKDDDEKDFFDIYTGQRVTPGKVNRFLVMPLFVGLQKRLFKDDIMDNFRPYINAAVGPSMIYVFPNNDDYFVALGKGQLKYTAGGYVGIGAFFGDEHASLLGLNIRYYYLPYFSGLESLQGVNKTQFGGFFITMNFGSVW